MVLRRISSNSSLSRNAEWGSSAATMPRIALSISAWSSTSSTYSRLIRSYTSANSLASSHGRAAGLAAGAACGGWLECSASTPLVSAAENPKSAPATRAITVRDRDDIITFKPPGLDRPRILQPCLTGQSQTGGLQLLHASETFKLMISAQFRLADRARTH